MKAPDSAAKLAIRSSFVLIPFLIWLMSLPFLAYSLIAAPTLRLDVGEWGDQAILQGFNSPEQSSTESYRWTTQQATIHFPQLSSDYRIFELRAHGWRADGPSPRVDIQVNEQPWGWLQTTPELRICRLLLPEPGPGQYLRLGLTSQSYSPPGDARMIGFAIDWLGLRELSGTAQINWLSLMMQALLLGLGMGLIGVLGFHLLRSRSPGLIFSQMALVCGLITLNLVQPLWLSLAIEPWLLIMAILLGLSLLLWLVPSSPLAFQMTTAGQPGLSMQQRWVLWSVLVLALATRLLGAAHPFFDSHDLPVHMRWMQTVAQGQLTLYSTPGELQNRLTFNPPAGYVLLMPLWLALADLRQGIQIGTALIDWLGCVFLLLIALRLRLSFRVSLIALMLYAWLPITMTMLWWGFVTNNIAQTCWLLLLWLILRLEDVPGRDRGAGVRDQGAGDGHTGGIGKQWQMMLWIGVAASVCLLMHVGALVLILAMLGLLALAGLVRLSRQAAAILLMGLGLAALVSALLYFSYVLPAVLTQPASGQSRSLAQSFARSLTMTELRLGLVGQAFHLGFTLPLLGAACSGLFLLAFRRRAHGLQAALIWGTVVVCLIFFGVYMFLGFLTRYIYFAAPIICLAGAVFLGRMRHRPGGRWLLIAVLIAVVFMGIELWFGGVLLRDKPSLVPLTH